MTNTLAVVKLLLALHGFIERLINEIADKAEEGERASLKQAIEDAKRATTDEAKRDAIKRIEDSFRNRA